MIDMFTSTGYEVTSCTPISVAGSRWASLIARLPWMSRDILAQQFVIVATPVQPGPPGVVRPSSSSSWLWAA